MNVSFRIKKYAESSQITFEVLVCIFLIIERFFSYEKIPQKQILLSKLFITLK